MNIGNVGVIARTNKRTGPRPHGRTKYVLEKCRCEVCRKANSEAEKLRIRLKAYGRYNCFTTPEASIEAMTVLGRRGLTRRDIERLTGISRTTLWKIWKGKRLKVTPETERRLTRLAQFRVIPANGRLVAADGAWETAYQIMACGYSKSWIARKLGSKTPALQMSHNKVRRSTAARLTVLYRYAHKYPASPSPEATRAIKYGRARLSELFEAEFGAEMETRRTLPL